MHRKKSGILLTFIVLFANISCSYFIKDMRIILILNENRTCELHNRKLDTKYCWINYGLFRFTEYLYTPNEYKKKMIYDSLYDSDICNYFKYYNIDKVVLGGCEIHSQKIAMVSYCKICNKEYIKWLEKYMKYKPNRYYEPISSIDCFSIDKRRKVNEIMKKEIEIQQQKRSIKAINH